MKVKNVALRVRLVVFAISLLSIVLPASVARAATSNFSGTLNLCKGDVFNYYESHGSSYTYTLKSNSDSTVAKGTGMSSAIQSGKFFSIEALKAGKTTIVFNFKKSGSGSTYTATLTVNVSDARVIELGKTATVEGWGNSNEKGSSTWSSSNITPSGLVSVKVDSGSTSAMKATLTAGSSANSGTVTIKNVSSNSGSEYIYAVTVTNPYTVIPTPAAETGLVYDGESHQCVKAGEHYTLGGTYTAVNADDYTATVTPKSGYCWEGGSTAAKTVKWTIARRPVTVTVVNTNKVEGAVFIDPDQQTYNDPIWTTTTEGLIASDTTELTWDIFRTNACEEVGTYDLLVEGAAKQGNYELTFVGGKYEICEAPPQGPTIPDDEGGLVYDPDLAEVVVTPNAGVSEVEIVNMPEDATATVPVTIDAVKGVEPTKIKVVHTTSDGTPYDITRAFAIAGDAASGVTIALDGAASVEIPLAGGGNETVTVEPRLTESGDNAIEPFEVDAGEVDVGVRTIPGLTYALTRSTTVVTVSEGAVVDSKRAEATRTKLSDPFEGGRPNEAFYVIRVTK